MRVGIIADIHGNYPALKAVLAELKKHGAELVLCAGDIVGFYPHFNEVAEELRLNSIASVLGNHDHALLTGASVPGSLSANLTIEYARKNITSANLAYLSSMPLARDVEAGGVRISMTHGGPDDPLNKRVYYSGDLKAPQGFRGVVIGGHTHIPAAFRAGGVLFINPGSCGQPRDFDIRASCCVLDLESMEYKFVRVFYDVDAVFSEMDGLEFDRRIAWSLYEGDWVGGSILGEAKALKVGPSVERAFEMRAFDYCLSLKNRSTGRMYRAVIRDGQTSIASEAVLLKGPLAGTARPGVKVKNGAAAVYKKINGESIEDISVFDGIDRTREAIIW